MADSCDGVIANNETHIRKHTMFTFFTKRRANKLIAQEIEVTKQIDAKYDELISLARQESEAWDAIIAKCKRIKAM